MAAALLPVGVGGDAVPLRHESDPGAWHAQKYGNLRRMRDGNQSVF